MMLSRSYELVSKPKKGFSLIELLIVLAIIGVIASIAYPSYQNYTCDTYRTQAVADLKTCALALDRFYSNGFTYVGAVIDGSAGATCPNRSPAEGQLMFNITLPVATAKTYTIQAAPVTGSSCGSTMQLTADGTLTES